MSETRLTQPFTCLFCEQPKEEVPYGPVGETWCMACWFKAHDQSDKNLAPGMRFEGDLMGMWAYHAKREPDYRTAEDKGPLSDFFDAWNRLKNLGWREAIYCPKDGSYFLTVEPGSTGVFPTRYSGEWPDGSWWVDTAGDSWPSHPCLWKPMPETTPDPASAAAPRPLPEQALERVIRKARSLVAAYDEFGLEHGIAGEPLEALERALDSFGEAVDAEPVAGGPPR